MSSIYHVDDKLPPPNTVVLVLVACGEWQWWGAFYNGTHWYTLEGRPLHYVEYWAP